MNDFSPKELDVRLLKIQLDAYRAINKEAAEAKKRDDYLERLIDTGHKRIAERIEKLERRIERLEKIIDKLENVFND